MPTIASFFGVSIKLYFKDHQPPHFHALHGDDEAMIAIAPVAVLAGSLPPARLKDVLAWAQGHQQDLSVQCRNPVAILVLWSALSRAAVSRHTKQTGQIASISCDRATAINRGQQ